MIPKELRDKYGIAPNSQMIVTEIANHIAVLPAPDPIRQGRGMLKLDRSVAESLRESRSTDAGRDAKLMRRFVPKSRRGLKNR